MLVEAAQSGQVNLFAGILCREYFLNNYLSIISKTEYLARCTLIGKIFRLHSSTDIRTRFLKMLEKKDHGEINFKEDITPPELAKSFIFGDDDSEYF